MFSFLCAVLRVCDTVQVRSVSGSMAVTVSLYRSSHCGRRIRKGTVLRKNSCIKHRTDTRDHTCRGTFPETTTTIISTLKQASHQQVIIFRQHPRNILPYGEQQARAKGQPRTGPRQTSTPGRNTQRSRRTRQVLKLHSHIRSQGQRQLRVTRVHNYTRL